MRSPELAEGRRGNPVVNVQDECFVFDHRVAVGHGIKVGSYQMCHGCGSPVAEQDVTSPYYELGVSCPQCYGKRSSAQLKRARERQQQYQRRGALHAPTKEKI